MLVRSKYVQQARDHDSPAFCRASTELESLTDLLLHFRTYTLMLGI
jgi:hypothetical protein